LTRFCLSCGIAIAPDRLPDGFGPITNREKDDSTITEPLRRPRCRINSRQQSRLDSRSRPSATRTASRSFSPRRCASSAFLSCASMICAVRMKRCCLTLACRCTSLPRAAATILRCCCAATPSGRAKPTQAQRQSSARWRRTCCGNGVLQWRRGASDMNGGVNFVTSVLET